MSIFDAPIPFKTRDTIFERLLINLKNPHFLKAFLENMRLACFAEY